MEIEATTAEQDNRTEVLEAAIPKARLLSSFRHLDAAVDAALEDALLEQLHAAEIEVDRLDQAQGLSILRLRDVPHDRVTELGRFVGMQSLGAFPEYHVVRPAAQPVDRLTPALFPPPKSNNDYPIVGVVHSGVDPSNPLLAPWIAGREEFVPASDRNHGTFVAGLIATGSERLGR